MYLIASAALCAQTALLYSQGPGQVLAPAGATQSDEWSGARTSGGRSQAIVLHLDMTGEGHGTIDLPDFGAIDIPAAKFEMTKSTIHFELVGDSTNAIFDGSVSPTEIYGHWKEGDRSGDFILHPSNMHDGRNALLRKNVFIQNGDVRLSGTLVMQQDLCLRLSSFTEQGLRQEPPHCFWRSTSHTEALRHSSMTNAGRENLPETGNTHPSRPLLATSRRLSVFWTRSRRSMHIE